MHSQDWGLTVPFLFSISKQNLVSGCWEYLLLPKEIGCVLLKERLLEELEGTIELKDLIEPGPWGRVWSRFVDVELDEFWKSIFHFSSLSPGFFRVTNYIKGWKAVDSFSLIIFFLKRMTEGSTMNLGSVAKQVTILLRASFLMKFSKYKGSSNS